MRFGWKALIPDIDWIPDGRFYCTCIQAVTSEDYC